jgi:hypothetical protein
MRKITLSCENESISTTCGDVSQHIWNKAVLHGLSARGINWLSHLPDNHARIYVGTSKQVYMLDYITDAPCP